MLRTAIYQWYMHSIEFSVRTMCSIEKRTNLWSGQWPYCFIQCFYQQDSGPNIIYAYNMTIEGDNLPLLWYLGWNWGNQVFCEIFVPGRNQRNQLNVLWKISYPNPETSLTLGMPRHTLLPNTLHTLQEATIQPRGLPYSQETALTVSPANPVYPSFRNRHTHGTQHTQSSRRPQGPHRLQDYKTANIASQQKA